MAVEVLKARGVPEDHILFLNIIASPEGVKNFATKFPRVKVVTAFIDQVKLFLPQDFIALQIEYQLTLPKGLDDKKYVNHTLNARRKLTSCQLYHTWSGRLWGQVLYHMTLKLSQILNGMCCMCRHDWVVVARACHFSFCDGSHSRTFQYSSSAMMS